MGAGGGEDEMSRVPNLTLRAGVSFVGILRLWWENSNAERFAHCYVINIVIRLNDWLAVNAIKSITREFKPSVYR